MINADDLSTAVDDIWFTMKTVPWVQQWQAMIRRPDFTTELLEACVYHEYPSGTDEEGVIVREAIRTELARRTERWWT